MLRFPGDGWSQPSRVVLDANLCTRMPRYAWANSRLGASGSGSGLAADSLVRTLGEYFERRHFYHEVRGQAEGTLTLCADQPGTQQKLNGQGTDADAGGTGGLFHALSQTCRPEARQRLSSHVFQLSRVIRLPDYRAVWAPTVLFSIGGPGLEGDIDFVPQRDTTGCAAHFNLTLALQGALREFVERQYLLRYWLLGAGGVDVSDSAMSGMSELGLGLAGRLGRLGRLCFIELSLGEIAAVVVLAVYAGVEDPQVRYCVGLSCAPTVADAADRAIRELWQSYIFLCNMSEPGAKALILDRYHRYFLDCNTLEIAHEMLSGVARSDPGVQSSHAADALGLAETASRQASSPPVVWAFTDSIHRRFGSLLAYVAQTPVQRRRMWCVRVLTPNAFLHLDNAAYFNRECAFSRPFAARIRPDRLVRMVPFP